MNERGREMLKNLSGKRAGILYAIIVFFIGGLLFLYLQTYIVPEGGDATDYCRLALSFINGWGVKQVKKDSVYTIILK